MQAGPVVSLSPSFNSYSNRKLVEIAARVVEEFHSEEFYDEFYYERPENSQEGEQNSDYVEDERVDNLIPESEADEDKEFEFSFVTRDSESSSPISADEIFHNGQIRPVYPGFDRDLLLEHHMKFQNENEKENCVRNSVPSKGPTNRLPLRKLFLQERETTMTTSSEAEELDGVPAETYCVWRPKAEEEEEEEKRRYKKSSSTRSNSKKWKFKDLLDRSNSHGRSKDSFVFFTHSDSVRKKEHEKKVKETPVGGDGKVKPVAAPPPYNRDGGEKQRSYLPYRQDLVGFFGNVKWVE